MSITAFPKHRRLNNLEISTLPGVQVSIVGSQTVYPFTIGTGSISYIRSDAAGGLVEISGLSSGSFILEDRGATSGNRRWNITRNNDQTEIRAFNDAGTVATQNFFAMDHSNGFVFVGAGTPLDKLHVSNNIRIDGTKFRVAGSLMEFETNGTVLRADLTSNGRFRVIGSGTTPSSLPSNLFRNSTLAVDAGGLWQIGHSGGLAGGLIIDSNEAVAGDFSTVARGVMVGRFTANTVLQNTLIVNPSTTTPGSRIQSNGVIQLGGIGRRAFNIGIGFGAANAISNMATYQMQPVDGSGNVINATTGFGMNFTYGLGTSTGTVQNGAFQKKIIWTTVDTLSRVEWDMMNTTQQGRFRFEGTGRIMVGAVTAPPARISFPASIVASGGIDFGVDTNLYRSAPNRLKTDDSLVVFGTLGLGTDTPVASALLEMVSTTQGFLPPRMTSIQRDAISTPASGLIVYDITNNHTNFFNGTAWKRFVFTPAATLTVGSVPFVIATGEIDDDNANFFWDNTNKRLGLGTATPDELTHIAKAIDGVFTGLLIENSQPNVATSTNETAEIRFGFGGNNDVARIVADKRNDYTTVADEDSTMKFFVDINGTATQVAEFRFDGLRFDNPSPPQIQFNATAGGTGNTGILYLDSGSVLRNALIFPGSNVVRLSNRASNGIVEIRANTATAGSGGEVLVATFEDDKVSTVMGASGSFSVVGGVADSQFTDVGNVGLGEDTLQTFTLPANALNANGKAIRIRATFRTAANGNVKTIKLHFGATVLGNAGAAAFNDKLIYFDVVVVRTGASAQRSMLFRFEGTDNVFVDNTLLDRTTPAEDTTGTIVIKGTGETTTNVNNDVIQESMIIEFLN